MTPEKQKQKLSGQSGIAQKAFQFVPIGEDWTPIQIAAALHQATGSRIDAHTLRGCLMTMVDAGLVRATASGTFQRAAVSSPNPVSQPKKTEKAKPAMTTPVAATAEKPAASAIDLLAGIAQKLRDLAQDIETAALAIEEGQAKTDQEAAKFKQLQALLKGMA